MALFCRQRLHSRTTDEVESHGRVNPMISLQTEVLPFATNEANFDWDRCVVDQAKPTQSGKSRADQSQTRRGR